MNYSNLDSTYETFYLCCGAKCLIFVVDKSAYLFINLVEDSWFLYHLIFGELQVKCYAGVSMFL